MAVVTIADVITSVYDIIYQEKYGDSEKNAMEQSVLQGFQVLLSVHAHHRPANHPAHQPVWFVVDRQQRESASDVRASTSFRGFLVFIAVHILVADGCERASREAGARGA